MEKKPVIPFIKLEPAKPRFKLVELDREIRFPKREK